MALGPFLAPRSRRARELTIAAVAALCLAAPAAFGQGAREAARAAYQRGKDAAARKDYATAVVELARADELSPNDVALEAALAAALLADDPAMGMALVERSARGAPGGSLALAVKQAREKFGGRAGRVRIACPPPAPCEATIDGKPAAVDRPAWVSAGPHRVVVTREGKAEPSEVTVAAGSTVEVAVTPPAPEPPPPPKPVEPAPAPEAAKPPPPEAAPAKPVGPGAAPVVDPWTGSPAPAHGEAEGGGLSPAWFFTGAGLTLVLGGLTVASGVDTLAKKDDFALDKTEDRAADGRAAQLRTNLLLGGAGLAALGTAALGIFAVEWGSKGTSAAVAPVPGGARATMTGRF